MKGYKIGKKNNKEQQDRQGTRKDNNNDFIKQSIYLGGYMGCEKKVRNE